MRPSTGWNKNSGEPRGSWEFQLLETFSYSAEPFFLQLVLCLFLPLNEMRGETPGWRRWNHFLHCTTTIFNLQIRNNDRWRFGWKKGLFSVTKTNLIPALSNNCSSNLSICGLFSSLCLVQSHMWTKQLSFLQEWILLHILIGHSLLCFQLNLVSLPVQLMQNLASRETTIRWSVAKATNLGHPVA